MRAFMSVPGARILSVGPVRDSQHAEAEARMLLSETRTEGRGATTAMDLPISAWHAAYVIHPQNPAVVALAEALAAFVDDGQEARS